MWLVINHSALNSEWKKHKYVAKKDGNYYYPDGTKGARTISTLKKKKAEDKTKDGKKKSSKAINKMAKDAITGKYGNGEDRKKKLGKKYDKVQNRVNQILLGKKAAKRIADSKEEKEKGKKALEKATKRTKSKSSTKKKTTKKSKTSTKKKTTTKSKKRTSSTKSTSSTRSTSTKNNSAVSAVKKQNAALIKKNKKQALSNAKLKGRLKALRTIAKIRG